MPMYDDPKVEAQFDVLLEWFHELPENIAVLIRQVDTDLRHSEAEIVKLEDGSFALRWRERHPEMASYHEFCELDPREKAKGYGPNPRWLEMLRVLPDSEYELPLTRKQAFALLTMLKLTGDGTADEFPSEWKALAGFLYQDNTKAQVYLEKTEKRWWEFLWPLISKQINAKLPKVKQSYKYSGKLYPSRYDHGARGHLYLIICLRVKGIL